MRRDDRPNLLTSAGPHRGLRFAFNVLVTGAFGVAVAGFITLVVVYKVLSVGLPKINTLNDYRPNLVTEVVDRHGTLIGEFMWENQRRYLVQVRDVPPVVIQAFVAAEDRGFFQHQGLDYLGILRAALANLQAGQIKQGGSTITQQVVKSLLLTPERTFTRKIREMILAKRIEDRLGKDEILYLYLNQIYFGAGAYGVEAAAREFFGKSVAQLDVAQAALLAGLVRAPGRYDPRRNPERTLTRRAYVIHRLHEDGYIDADAEKRALATPLGVVPRRDVNATYAPDYVEYVRRYLMDKYGADRVLRDGLRVETACDVPLQRVAYRAIDLGLRQHAKRQGILDLPPTLPRDRWPAELEAIARRNQDRDPTDVREGLVLTVDDVGGLAKIDLGGRTVRIPFAQMRWVRTLVRDGRSTSVQPKRVSDLLRVGDRVPILPGEKGAADSLSAWPAAQGALLSMDVTNREVLAMVGGRDFATSEFNRAVQARRQPGSAFKPIVYSAALAAGLTPATVFTDTALVFADNWKPANYDRKFRGYMSLREALTKSINTVTIRVADMLGVDYLVRFAHRLGITGIRGGDLSMAIGTYEMTLLELVNTYDVFATGGRWGEPVFVRRVTDRDGQVLDEYRLAEFVEQVPPMEGVPDVRQKPTDLPDAFVDRPTTDPDADGRLLEFLRDFGLKKKGTPEPSPTPAPTPEPRGHVPSQLAAAGQTVWRQVIDPQVAYVITNMMHSVASAGTGARSNILGRVLAGKTGTTNEYADAWFIGFSPQVIAGVWVGYDQGAKSLGGGESGSSTALPIWIDFMREALADQPAAADFPVPPGVVFADVDPQTGLLAPPDGESRREVFVAGTEPTEYAPSAAAPAPDDFFEVEFDGE